MAAVRDRLYGQGSRNRVIEDQLTRTSRDAWKARQMVSHAAAPVEPLSEGQLRSFIIRRLDPAAKRIELAAV